MKPWRPGSCKKQARFSEFLNDALTKGPQVVTRRGVEEAVLVPIEEWRKMQQSSRPNIKELLLSGPRFDFKLPKRGRWKNRAPVDFSHPDFK